ncbi:hypothetical protein SCAPIOD100042 [Staphylococcus capitis]|nr:hypothetical protein CR01_140241 [Staphylococcus capitis CR01]CQD26257.1 hypothetical protein SCAPIOD100042 [Staphylococcus capitis]CQD26703.1 hypothetical protein SCAPIOD130042 [Staphylococcus capitis]CQD30781.1 hypothetical protein SCAPIOD110041 [Staphylococcus capitis]CRN10593.1 hypothetical protein BN1517100042 [Staphylococcus capitis]
MKTKGEKKLIKNKQYILSIITLMIIDII